MNSETLAGLVRQDVVRMTHLAAASHVGSGMSAADILAVLYAHVLRIDPARPDEPHRDRLLVSKGHAAAAVFATLARRGFFSPDWLDDYCADGSRLPGHVTSHGVPGVEWSTGSLGHALPVACGMSLALRASDRHARVFALLSDGELDEGSNWEAILFAGHHRLGNLTAIIDANGIQSFGRVGDILSLEPLAEKWRCFGWLVVELDGHNHQDLRDALSSPQDSQAPPTVVIARTIKGKGVSFMQDQLLWHYRSPNAEELQLALAELRDADRVKS